MRDYFNETERTTHIIILSMTEICKNFLARPKALSEQEIMHLKKALEHLEKFNNSIMERLGNVYKKKIKGTLEENTIRFCSRHIENKDAISYFPIEEMQEMVENIMAIHCSCCDKENYKKCPVRDMAIACGIKDNGTEKGCQYKIELGELE